MNLKEQRAALVKAAQGIIDGAKDAGRDLTVEEQAAVEAKFSEIADLDLKIAEARKSAELIDKLAGFEVAEPVGQHSLSLGNQGIGNAFVASDAFRAFAKAHPTGVGSGTPIRLEVKGLGSVRDLGIGTKATITTQTGQPGPQREPGYRNALPGDAAPVFLDLVTVGSTNVPYAEYAQLVSENDKAAIVAEGELKPLSDITTGKDESKAFTYADGFDITNQTLADDGALAAVMEARVRVHIRGVIEDKLLNGTGTATEPKGILSTTGTLVQAFDTDVVTTLGRALDTFETANPNLEPQAIVMRSADIWALRFLKGSDGHYLLGNPLQQGIIPTPWGIPIVRSNKVPTGKVLVGRFDSMHYLELEALSVLAFNQHKDYAQRNMVYVRAETRGRQVFYVPREVVVATITGASG